MAEKESGFRVWIEQELCTADGSCYNLVPDVFHEGQDGIAYVREGDKVFDGSTPETPGDHLGVAIIPEELLPEVIEEAENCPGECIFIERRDAPM